MALNEIQKLTANIVVLSATETTLEMSSQELAPFLKDVSVEMAQPPMTQVKLVSLREQVVILVGGNQFVFSDESDLIPPKARLAEVVQGMTALLSTKGVRFRAYGYNFDIAFDCSGDTTAGELLRDRFLRTDTIVRRANLTPRGAGIRLLYEMGDAKCNLQIEPREQSVSTPQFFAHVNYHYDLPTGEFPQADVIRSDFQGKWVTFTEVLERLLYQ